MTIEISFPRGGRKPPPNAKPQDFQREHDLFGGKRNKQINKHAAKSNVIQEEYDSSKTETRYVEKFSTKTIQDGMILLGCVTQIQKVALQINLPGSLQGKVFANNISKSYTKLLQTVIDNKETDDFKQLDELFTLGKCVAVKVLNLNDEKHGLTLSMMPEQINANISHTSVKTGMTLWGAISEVEDHGYVVDLGINHCRAFLKKENCDVDNNYAVGELLWFSVTKADISSTAATIMLNAKEQKVRDIKINDVISLDHLLPGMQLDFTISEILKDGLQGTFFNDYTGYIDARQLTKSIHNHDEYTKDKVIQARILYTMPVTKIAYFTLKSLEPRKRGKVKDGAIVKCKIKGVTRSGIHIKFRKDEIGLVPMHRARNMIPPNTDTSYFSYLNQLYRNQSQQRCRVLNYNYFEQIYICTMEKEFLDKDMKFSLKNLEPGQTVSANIKEIQPNGFVVKIQQVSGFIKNEHICDTVVKNYNNIKSRFKVGQTVQARVWVVNQEKNMLYLTMRPSLVNTDFILKDYQYAEVNQQILGVIKQVTNTGLLVQFFGDIYGWVPINKMMFAKVENFKIGQLVKCSVVKCRNTKLTLSLQSSTEISEDSQPELKLGEHVDGIVSHVTTDGVHIAVKNSDITAFVPILYTSKFPKLAPIIAKMYQRGDEISNLVCVSKNDILPTLSLRDSELNEDNIQNINDLKKGIILPCSVSTTHNNGINIEAPIIGYEKTVFVPKKNLSDDRNISPSNLMLNQQIYANVFVANNLGAPIASTKLTDVWDYDVQSSVQYFSEYLKEVLRIREHFKSLEDPLASLNLGEIVSGVVESINDDKSCIVKLENGVRAFVQKEHTKDNLSIKDKVEGVVLYWNFEENVAEIALCSKLISRINQLQNGVIKIPAGATNKSNTHAEVILVKEDFVLGVLRGAAGKRQLIFFPSKLHTNDMNPDLSSYVIGEYINVQVKKTENGIIIGLLKQLVKELNYKKKRNLINKRKLGNNSEEQPETKRIKLENSNEKENKKDKKKKEKTNNKTEIVENNTEDNSEVKIKTVKVKEENSSPKKNDNKIVTKSKKDKKEEKIKNEEIIETNKNKKERKKLNSISSEEENVNIIVKEQKNKKEKQKKRKLDKDKTSEIQISQEKKHAKLENSNDTKNKKDKMKKEKTNKKPEIIENNNEDNSEDENNSENNSEVENNSEDISEVENNSENNSEDEDNSEDNSKDEIIKKGEQKKRKLDKDDTLIQTSQPIKISKQNPTIADIPAILPGADNFWNTSQEPENIFEESSDDDEPNQKELEQQQKKKKMTPAEKAEAARLEEERIRKIELELADSETTPKTADQFERLVLANPNNSMLWINYMAFQLEATEIEKARIIARKALSTIDFREEQEKLNVWIAFLNLENRYGAKESFASVLQEAVKMNDSLSVYLQALNILSESKKTTEFLDLLKIVSRKFKQEFKMWTETAEACYKNDLKEAARDLMQRSLKSLDEKQHINILVQFAFMEARHCEPERAEALLEKVLASYPRRVDVWTSYIDMLIKGNKIHIARNVLERAVGQKLPARKMKTIFSKYVQFETKYGDEDSVKKVRQLAAEYVKTALN